MKKHSKILSVILCICIIAATVDTFTNANEVVNEQTQVGTNEQYKGNSGNVGDYWIFYPDSGTLAFYGRTVQEFDCSEFADEVKHVVFENTIERVSADNDERTTLPNLKTVHISSNMNRFYNNVFSESSEIKEYTVDPRNKYYYTIDGDLYLRGDGTYINKDTRRLVRCAVGKANSTYEIAEGTTEISNFAFLGNNDIEKIILPESVTKLEMPFIQASTIDNIEIYNPECEIAYQSYVEVDEELTIYSYAESKIEELCNFRNIDFEAFTFENVVDISIEEYPCKSLLRGEIFHENNLKLRVKYDDGKEVIRKLGYKTTGINTYNSGVSTVEVTYGNFELTYEVEVLDIPKEIILDENDIMHITVPKGEKVKYFIEPKKTQQYKIYTEGLFDTYLELYEGDKKIDFNDDSGAMYNGEINSIKLEEGKIYQLYVSSYEEKDISINVKTEITNTIPNDGYDILALIDKQIVNNKLKITYIVSYNLNETQSPVCKLSDLRLEKSVDGIWTEIEPIADIELSDVVIGENDRMELTIPLDKYYGDLESGNYKFKAKLLDRTLENKFKFLDLNELNKLAQSDDAIWLNEGRNTIEQKSVDKYRMTYFTPTKSGKYSFCGECYYQIRGYLYDLSGIKLREAENAYFKMEYELVEGKTYSLMTYIFGVKEPIVNYDIVVEYIGNTVNNDQGEINTTIVSDDEIEINTTAINNETTITTTNKNEINEDTTTNTVVKKTVNNIKTQIKKIKTGRKSLIISWNKKSKVDGYNIQISRTKKFVKVLSKHVKKNKKLVKFRKLKSKKKYYVRVRTYIKKEGVKIYSKWSRIKYKKVK